MDLPRVGTQFRVPITMMIVFALIVPATLWAQDYKEFISDEFGFSMKYPATWVKIEKPKGNYYKQFQAPDLTDNFRASVHVAAHKPVKDPTSAYLQEFRNGIKDLQKTSGAGKEKQEVRILDEGEFKCEVPGAYFFFIQALEDKLRIWLDIVIVFYKQDQTLLRVSCLAPSSSMEKFQQMFNDVLVSVKFVGGEAEVAPPPRTTAPPPAPGPPPSATPPPPRPAPPAMVPEPAPEIRSQPPERPMPPAATPKPGPRGPSREPERPATGIVN